MLDSKYITNSCWIWSDPKETSPVNRFTYFRKVFHLDTLPENGDLYFAADSNAQIWLNGHCLRRKVTRYREESITAETIHAGPYLKLGNNVILVLHHNWGPITCFMRTGNLHAGLWLGSAWMGSDASWKWSLADAYLAHERQILCKHGTTPRIRFPVVCDARRFCPGVFGDDFDDSGWQHAYIVKEGPWPEIPLELETPGQREYPVEPLRVLNAGYAQSSVCESVEDIADCIKNATLHPDAVQAKNWQAFLGGSVETVEVSCEAGECIYVTFDFERPLHGYPCLQFADASAGVVIDFAYAEVARTLYAGESQVREDGWIDPTGIVGLYYADRYITRQGSQCMELPDERTARWLSLRFHFKQKASVTVNQVAIIKSQYPIERFGSFDSGNELVNRIVNLCVTHAEVTMSDAYVDTPGREDGQWIEDTRLRAILAASWFNATRLRRLCIRTFSEGEDGNGNFHPFYPSNYPYPAGAIDWSVQWLGMLYDEYMWSADADWLRPYLSQMQRFWQWVKRHTNEEGLLVTNQLFADIRMLPAPAPGTSSGVVTAFLLERLQQSIALVESLSESVIVDDWCALYTHLKSGFMRFHRIEATDSQPTHIGTIYDPESDAYERGFGQAAQINAVCANLLDEAEVGALLDYVFTAPDGSPPEGVVRWNNPTFAYSALRALSNAGRAERAVRHLLERYSPYLPGHPRNPVAPILQGSSGGPLPEYWVSREDISATEGAINPHQPGDETGSHGWGAVILQWLHDSLLGVRVMEPGGTRIAIAPEAGGLPYVNGHTMTPKGGVYVYWDPQQWLLKINLPANVVGELKLPQVCLDKASRCLHSDGNAKLTEGLWVLEGAGSYQFRIG
jgi:hypothetical protein